jgi:CheY-like chemotaxis protein
MCTILLVEDDKDIRESASALLNACGHRVDEVENGQEALDWLASHRQNPPCLAIVDMMMPVMDGWELIGKLRRDPFWNRLYVIVFSAVKGHPDDVGDAVAANDFWPKPPRLDQFEALTLHCPYHAQSLIH